MIKKLVSMYEVGAITGYQVMIHCLHMLDPDHPDLVLSDLPWEILGEMMEYARRYDPRLSHPPSFILPADDQVRAAEAWINARRVMSSTPVGH